MGCGKGADPKTDLFFCEEAYGTLWKDFKMNSLVFQESKALGREFSTWEPSFNFSDTNFLDFPCPIREPLEDQDYSFKNIWKFSLYCLAAWNQRIYFIIATLYICYGFLGKEHYLKTWTFILQFWIINIKTNFQKYIHEIRRLSTILFLWECFLVYSYASKISTNYSLLPSLYLVFICCLWYRKSFRLEVSRLTGGLFHYKLIFNLKQTTLFLKLIRMTPQNMSLWHTDYFKMRILQIQQMQKKKKCGKRKERNSGHLFPCFSHDQPQFELGWVSLPETRGWKATPVLYLWFSQWDLVKK